MSSAAGKAPGSGSAKGPLISLGVLDAPTQRLYAISAFVLIQAYKFLLVVPLFSGRENQSPFQEGPLAALGSLALDSQDGLFALPQAALLDFVILFGLFKLRIPRLTFTIPRLAVVFGILFGVNYTIATEAAWVGKTLGLLLRAISLLIPGLGSSIKKQLGISENWVRVPDLISPKSRILGQHTIHILPHSTAQVAPALTTGQGPTCKCIGPLTPSVTVPLAFNNTRPKYLQYTILPLYDEDEPVTFNVTISDNELRHVEGHGKRERELTRAEEEELDLEELEEIGGRGLAESERDGVDQQAPWRRRRKPSTGASLRKRLRRAPEELIYELQVTKIGRLRLERVMDKDRRDAMIKREQDVIVVECPSASFSKLGQTLDLTKRQGKFSKSDGSATPEHVCSASEVDLHFEVRGVGPLELGYSVTQSAHRTPKKRDVQRKTISHLLPPPQGDNLTTYARADQTKLPLNLQARFAGNYEVKLEKIKDACGNEVNLDALANHIQLVHTEKIISHGHPKARLAGCDARRPVILLDGQPARKLALRVDEVDEEWSAVIRYAPEDGTGGQASQFTLEGNAYTREVGFDVAEPGTYTIETVNSTHCSGLATSPWVCTGLRIPKPSASIVLDTIDDLCAGAVGIKAKADLVGTPPFTIGYEVKHNGVVRRRQWMADRSRAEFDLPLEAEGTVEYAIVSLADAYYRDAIPLDGPRLKRTIHPLASATFVGSQGRSPTEPLVVRSCSGDSVQAEVQLEGLAPFELFYETRSSTGVSSFTQSKLGSGRHTLDIPLPENLAKKGGQMVVTLSKVRDSRGCEKNLTATDLRVDVKREKPTLAFTPFKPEDRRAHILEGGEEKLPITLTGEGPWMVRYAVNGHESEKKITQADSYLIADQAGEYKLLSVKDAACPGQVVESQSVFVVTSTARPKVRFADGEATLQKNGTFRRAPVCRGVRDEVALHVSGQFPVSVAYEHRAPSWQGHHHGVTRDSFSAVQEFTYLQLETAEPGWHRYELTAVGDALYALKAGHHGTLEQLVFSQPKASFQSADAYAFCLHESLDQGNKPPILHLQGQPPFTVEVQVDSPSSVSKTYTLEDIHSANHALELAGKGFSFEETGRWTASIRSIVDGNGCRTEYSDRAGPERHGSIVMEVMETAGITSIGSREDYCIGESVDFTLRGTPPWSITYAFNGKNSTATSRSSDFSRVAEKVGTFEIKSVAHRQNKCRLEVHDPETQGLRKQVHDLPSVKIRGGKHYVEDLLEGTQAEIIFTFEGEPPFSFTYQRTEPIDTTASPRVLETQTITGVLEKQYSVYASQEGTWAVTWLQDRHCAVSIDGSSRRSLGKSRLAITES